MLRSVGPLSGPRRELPTARFVGTLGKYLTNKIGKLDGPPSTFMPSSAAENRQLPLRCYVDDAYRDGFAGFLARFGTFITCRTIPYELYSSYGMFFGLQGQYTVTYEVEFTDEFEDW